MRFTSVTLLLATSSALQLQGTPKSRAPGASSAQPVPLGAKAAAAFGTASALLLPGAASAAEDASGGWALPALPTLPDWATSKEAHDLGVYLAQTVISWGVPAAAIGGLALLIGPFGGKPQDGPRPLPPALAKALGMTNEPKEFLEIEKLNDKLRSFEYSFDKASTSQASALRSKSKADVERQFGAEFTAFNLEKEKVDMVFTAAVKYRKAEEKATKRLEAIAAQFRAATLAPTALPGKAAAAAAVPGASTTEVAEGETAKPSASFLDKVRFGTTGPPTASSTTTAGDAAAPGTAANNVLQFGGGAVDKALQPLMKEKAVLEAQKTQLELQFLRELSTILTKDQTTALASVLKTENEMSGPSVTGSPTGGPTRLDTLSALVTAAAEAAGKSKQVYVLKFFGDVTASQVSSLRQEVTAVLQTADVEGRGDEVVLVLNTGGGTVTGYGLAAAQLLRLKDAGLHVTVCVEQVAASGGYLMACVADKIVAAPFAVLGSIGVITEIPNVYERLKKEGVEFSTVTAGKYKRTLTPTKKIEEADLTKTKEDIEGVLTLFKRFVAENRPKVNIDEIATGETWIGPDALARDMVDRLATVDDVLLDHVRDGAEVFGVTYKEKPKSPLAALAGAGAQGVAPSVQSLALAWLAQNFGTNGGAASTQQLGELQALLQQSRSGQAPQGGMLQMPTDEPEPMMLWGDEQTGNSQDTWFL